MHFCYNINEKLRVKLFVDVYLPVSYLLTCTLKKQTNKCILSVASYDIIICSWRTMTHQAVHPPSVLRMPRGYVDGGGVG